MDKIKLLIADDHSIHQHGLCSAFEMEKEILWVKKAKSGHEAVELCKTYFPHVVIMDISMPELNGIEATKRILKENPGIKVIALSMHIEKVYINGMLNAGASGYILKSCSFRELMTGIQTVLDDRTYFCREVKSMIHLEGQVPVSDDSVSVFQLLSGREREVLQLIAEGHKSRSIAQKLNISVKTVDIHRTNLKNKLNIHTIAELTKFAISEGLTSATL